MAAAGRREQGDLGDLGLEDPAQLGEQRRGRGAVGRGALEQLARLVEVLHPQVPLALGAVGDVPGDQGGDRRQQQPELVRILPEYEHREQREAGVGHPGEQLEAEALEHGAERRPPLREGDRDHDQADPERRDRGDDEEHRHPGGRGERPPGGEQVADRDRRGLGLEREEGDVEEELERGLPAEQPHRDRRAEDPGDDHARRVGEEETDDERHLAEREGVGAAAEGEAEARLRS